MPSSEVPVFFAVDDNYAAYLAVAIKSLTAHTDPARQYHLISLCDNLNTANQDLLKTYQQANVTISFVAINAQLKQAIDDRGNKLRSDYFTFTIYFRLFIAELFPDLDKAIYLDADTVILDDIAKLYDVSLGENLIGGSGLLHRSYPGNH